MLKTFWRLSNALRLKNKILTGLIMLPAITYLPCLILKHFAPYISAILVHLSLVLSITSLGSCPRPTQSCAWQLEMWAWDNPSKEVIFTLNSLLIFSEDPIAFPQSSYHNLPHTSMIMNLISILYFHHLAQCLIMSRCLRNIC